jgi:hypothetical protein
MNLIHSFLVGITLIVAFGLFWNFIRPVSRRAETWCDITMVRKQGMHAINLPINATFFNNVVRHQVGRLEQECRSPRDFFIVAVGYHKSGHYHLHWATFTLVHRASDGALELPNAGDLKRIAKRTFKEQGLTGFHCVTMREMSVSHSAVLC